MTTELVNGDSATEKLILWSKYRFHFLNPLMTDVRRHIDTSQLICIANQLNGFYMMRNIGR